MVRLPSPPSSIARFLLRALSELSWLCTCEEDVANPYMSHAGELRHIHRLRFWPLTSVLQEKYLLSFKEAEELSSFLLPMLRLHPERRSMSDEMLLHSWLTGVTVAGEIEAAERIEKRMHALSSPSILSQSAQNAAAVELAHEQDALKPVGCRSISVSTSTSTSTSAVGTPADSFGLPGVGGGAGPDPGPGPGPGASGTGRGTGTGSLSCSFMELMPQLASDASEDTMLSRMSTDPITPPPTLTCATTTATATASSSATAAHAAPPSSAAIASPSSAATAPPQTQHAAAVLATPRAAPADADRPAACPASAHAHPGAHSSTGASAHANGSTTTAVASGAAAKRATSPSPHALPRPMATPVQ